MAPSTASDIGRTAAETVWMGRFAAAVARAIAVSRRTQRIAKENFALAVGYNVLAVPLAMAGFVSPLVAAVAMSTSSIIVVANALRVGLGKTRRQACQARRRTRPAPPGHEGRRMNVLLYLIPIALFMGGVGLAAFIWSLKSGQYDDLEGAAWRILQDDDTPKP